MRHSAFPIFLFLAASLFLAACEHESVVDLPSNGHIVSFLVSMPSDVDAQVKSQPGSLLQRVNAPSDTLYLAASNSSEWPVHLSTASTRGSMTNLPQFKASSAGFGLYGFIASDGETIYPDFRYVYNTTASKWMASSFAAYWLSDATKVKFYAYAPYGEVGISSTGLVGISQVNEVYSDTETDEDGDPLLISSEVVWNAFDVAADMSDQVDLLLASNLGDDGNGLPGNYNASVSLKFRHALAAVRFKVGGGLPTTSVLNRIVISDVYKSGTFTFSSSSTDASHLGTWATSGSKTDFELDLSSAPSTLSVGDYLPSGNQFFMMMPQKFGSTSTAKISFEFASKTYTFSLANTEWKAGYTTTYTLSGTADFTVTVEDFDAEDDNRELQNI